MKKGLVFLLTAVMLFSLAACSGGNPGGNPAKNLPSFEFTQYGKARITIVGAEFAKDEYDDDFLRVYYDYTNTGDTAIGAYPSSALEYGTIIQDGEECNVLTFSEWDECAIPEDLGYDSGVLPGCTARHTMLIECDPDGGVVEIPCYIMIGSWVYEESSIDYFTFQIDPKNMMGAPDPLVTPAITKPTYAAGLPTSGTTDYPTACSLSINGWELTADDEGKTVLRVKLTVSNLSEEDILPPVSIMQVEAYQDGIALPWVDAWDLEEFTEEDEAFRTDVYPGETVSYNALFQLRNESPVEVVAEQQNDELRLGIVCDVAAILKQQKDAQQAAIDAANKAHAETLAKMIGVWDRTDSWPDHLTFYGDNTGIHDMTGDEFPFTYTLEEGLLCLRYDDGDYAEYYLEVEENDLTLTDDFDNVQTFVRAGS